MNHCHGRRHRRRPRHHHRHRHHHHHHHSILDWLWFYGLKGGGSSHKSSAAFICSSFRFLLWRS